MSAEVVVGGGLGAARAAAALARTGRKVLHLGSTAVDHPEVPEGRGLSQGGAEARAALVRSYGAAPVAASPGRAVWREGRSHPLPLTPVSQAGLVGPEGLRELLRARLEGETRALAGGGREERSLADHALHRLGGPAAERLVLGYARRRWGDPREVGPAVALRSFQPAAGDWLAHGSTPALGVRHLEATPGVSREDGEVVALEVSGGRVRAVASLEGRVEVERVWVAAPLAHVVGWLGEHGAPLRRTVPRLVARHRFQVVLRREGPGAELAGETHLLDPPLDCPVFALHRPDTQPGMGGLAGCVVAWLSLDPEHPLASADDAALGQAVVAECRRLGLPRVVADGRVVRLWHHDPAWLGPWHPLALRTLATLDALGVHLVGRATHFRLDAAAELELVELLAGGADPREVLRLLADPPVAGAGITVGGGVYR